MQKTFFLAGCLMLSAATLTAQSGRIGIGTNTPLARLHVADSSVLFSAPGDTSTTPQPPPISGPGRGMMWYADKAAFRAGYIPTEAWLRPYIGAYSVAAGYDAHATAPGTVALGFRPIAAGFGSVCLGYNTTGGNYGFSAGSENASSGSHSVTMGYRNGAADFATAIGSWSLAQGQNSVALGEYSNAYGNWSTAINYSNFAGGDRSTAAGYLTMAHGSNSFVVGALNDTLVRLGYNGFNFDNPLFIVGNGNDLQGERRSNALVVYQSGNTDHNGFTRLGPQSEGSPLIKIKEISTAVSAATEGGVVTIPHGLYRFNILSLTALLVYGNGDVIPGFRGTPGFEYSIAFDDTNIYIYNIAGNSANILSKPLKILITYKQ